MWWIVSAMSLVFGLVGWRRYFRLRRNAAN
jgi:hypothetical protein